MITGLSQNWSLRIRCGSWGQEKPLVLLEAREKSLFFAGSHYVSPSLHKEVLGNRSSPRDAVQVMGRMSGTQGALELHFSFHIVSATSSYLKVSNLFGKSKDILAVLVVGSEILKVFL